MASIEGVQFSDSSLRGIKMLQSPLYENVCKYVAVLLKFKCVVCGYNDEVAELVLKHVRHKHIEIQQKSVTLSLTDVQHRNLAVPDIQQKGYSVPVSELMHKSVSLPVIDTQQKTVTLPLHKTMSMPVKDVNVPVLEKLPESQKQREPSIYEEEQDTLFDFDFKPAMIDLRTEFDFRSHIRNTNTPIEQQLTFSNTACHSSSSQQQQQQQHHELGVVADNGNQPQNETESESVLVNSDLNAVEDRPTSNEVSQAVEFTAGSLENKVYNNQADFSQVSSQDSNQVSCENENMYLTSQEQKKLFFDMNKVFDKVGNVIVSNDPSTLSYGAMNINTLNNSGSLAVNSGNQDGIVNISLFNADIPTNSSLNMPNPPAYSTVANLQTTSGHIQPITSGNVPLISSGNLPQIGNGNLQQIMNGNLPQITNGNLPRFTTVNVPHTNNCVAIPFIGSNVSKTDHDTYSVKPSESANYHSLSGNSNNVVVHGVCEIDGKRAGDTTGQLNNTMNVKVTEINRENSAKSSIDSVSRELVSSSNTVTSAMPNQMMLNSNQISSVPAHFILNSKSSGLVGVNSTEINTTSSNQIILSADGRSWDSGGLSNVLTSSGHFVQMQAGTSNNTALPNQFLLNPNIPKTISSSFTVSTNALNTIPSPFTVCNEVTTPSTVVPFTNNFDGINTNIVSMLSSNMAPGQFLTTGSTGIQAILSGNNMDLFQSGSNSIGSSETSNVPASQDLNILNSKDLNTSNSSKSSIVSLSQPNTSMETSPCEDGNNDGSTDSVDIGVKRSKSTPRKHRSNKGTSSGGQCNLNTLADTAITMNTQEGSDQPTADAAAQQTSADTSATSQPLVSRLANEKQLVTYQFVKKGLKRTATSPILIDENYKNLIENKKVARPKTEAEKIEEELEEISRRLDDLAKMGNNPVSSDGDRSVCEHNFENQLVEKEAPICNKLTLLETVKDKVTALKESTIVQGVLKVFDNKNVDGGIAQAVDKMSDIKIVSDDHEITENTGSSNVKLIDSGRTITFLDSKGGTNSHTMQDAEKVADMQTNSGNDNIEVKLLVNSNTDKVTLERVHKTLSNNSISTSPQDGNQLFKEGTPFLISSADACTETETRNTCSDDIQTDKTVSPSNRPDLQTNIDVSHATEKFGAKETEAKEKKSALDTKRAQSCAYCGEEFNSIAECFVHYDDMHKDGLPYRVHRTNQGLTSENVKNRREKYIKTRLKTTAIDDFGLNYNIKLDLLKVLKECKRKQSLNKHKSDEKNDDDFDDNTDDSMDNDDENDETDEDENISSEGTVCPMCYQKFKKHSHLERHISIIHYWGRIDRPKKDIGLFICDTCGKSFKYKKNLDSHIRSIHQGQRRVADYGKRKMLECSSCGYNTKEKRRLENHILSVHMGQMPYKCQHCTFVSSERRSLKDHMYRHFKQKPVSCAYCDYGCIQKNAMKIHLKKQHGIELDLIQPHRKLGKNAEEGRSKRLSLIESNSKHMIINKMEDLIYSEDAANSGSFKTAKIPVITRNKPNSSQNDKVSNSKTVSDELQNNWMVVSSQQVNACSNSSSSNSIVSNSEVLQYDNNTKLSSSSAISDSDILQYSNNIKLSSSSAISNSDVLQYGNNIKFVEGTNIVEQDVNNIAIVTIDTDSMNVSSQRVQANAYMEKATNNVAVQFTKQPIVVEPRLVQSFPALASQLALTASTSAANSTQNVVMMPQKVAALELTELDAGHASEVVVVAQDASHKDMVSLGLNNAGDWSSVLYSNSGYQQQLPVVTVENVPQCQIEYQDATYIVSENNSS